MRARKDLPNENSSAALHGWSQVAPIMHPGETGEAYWRTLNIGDPVSRFRSSHHFAATSFANFGIERTLASHYF
jgi:hypothetical protein